MYRVVHSEDFCDFFYYNCDVSLSLILLVKSQMNTLYSWVKNILLDIRKQISIYIYNFKSTLFIYVNITSIKMQLQL